MSFTFVLNRAQKITTAIYLVTELFSASEPLRHDLRKKSLEFLSDIRKITDNPVHNDYTIDAVKGELEHILAMSDIALRSRMISEMNHGFLKAEIELFVQDIVAMIRRSSDGGTIATTLKDITTPKIAVKGLLPKKTISAHKGHTKGHDIGHIGQTPQPVFGQFNRMTGPIKDITTAPQTGGNRKDKIYEIIKEKGELTIKDIAQVAPEYSEKTIQRDLVDMVGSGRLHKKGERRWTVYFV